MLPFRHSRAYDEDGDGNVDLYDRSRIDHNHYDYIDEDGGIDEAVEDIGPPVEGARRLDTFGDDLLIYEVRINPELSLFFNLRICSVKFII